MINEKASLVQIPSGYKSGTLYSVVPNTSAGDFTVTGDPEGEATRVNKDGLIESVAANVPRLNYDPSNPQDPHLLLEPERTNFNTNSENFSSSYSTVGSPVSVENNLTSPNGGINAAKQTIATTGNGYYKFPTTVTENTDYTVSAFFKYISGAGEVVRFGAAGGVFGGDQENRINIKTGVVEFTNTGNTVVVEEYPNEWYRVSCTKDANADGTGGFSMFTNADDMVFGWWGVQFEAGSYPTSYIPTTIAVTRTKDTCINGGDDALFNDSEGVLFADLEALGEGTTVRKISLSNGSTDFVNFNFNATSGRVDFEFGSTSNSFYIVNSTGHTLTDRNKIAIKYKSGDTDCYINGTRVTGGNGTFTLSGLDRLNAEGRATNGTQSMYAKIHQLMVFNEALTDSELQTLTT